MKIKDIVTDTKAIEVLRGCNSVVIDVKAKIQYWTLGAKVTDKLIKAGAVLDGIVENNKRVWNTVWMHVDNCSCRGCLIDHNTHKVSVIRKAHPRKVALA